MIDLTHFIEDKKMTQLFARILKQKRCYMSYIRDMATHGHNELYDSFAKNGFGGNFVEKAHHRLPQSFLSLNGNNIREGFFTDIIDRSFYWDETEKGDAFWGDIYDDMWRLPILKKKISYEDLSRIAKKL